MENSVDTTQNKQYKGTRKKKKLLIKILVVVSGIALLFTSFLPFLPYLFR